MEGVLYKWTNYMTGWQPRWFVLDDGVISYYDSEDDVGKGSKGSIKMSVCEIKGWPAGGVPKSGSDPDLARLTSLLCSSPDGHDAFGADHSRRAAFLREGGERGGETTLVGGARLVQSRKLGCAQTQRCLPGPRPQKNDRFYSIRVRDG
uniref:PH domain-containing protein n=1 Tax=Hippocampus comes TaxID=109280 RepID=A0A3Q2YGH6_HIPCM